MGSAIQAPPTGADLTTMFRVRTRTVMEIRGVTAVDLAARTGVSKSVVMHRLNGTRQNVPTGAFEEMLGAMGVKHSILFRPLISPNGKATLRAVKRGRVDGLCVRRVKDLKAEGWLAGSGTGIGDGDLAVTPAGELALSMGTDLPADMLINEAAVDTERAAAALPADFGLAAV